MSLNNYFKFFIFLSIIYNNINFAGADSVISCPIRLNDSIQQIDIFDGKPEEMAYLAPDDDKSTPSIYSLRYIYDQGRTVTIRCKYNSGSIFDRELKDKVNKCTFMGYNTRNSEFICE